MKLTYEPAGGRFGYGFTYCCAECGCDVEENEAKRPFGLTLLTGLYLFFFILSLSTYGNPFPFMGRIYQDLPAKVLVFFDSLVCIYLFIGISKRQLLTWYLLLFYNLFEI